VSREHSLDLLPDYRNAQSQRLQELEACLTELAHATAALADVDGAIVLSTRFETIGFGAEIVGDLWDVPNVGRALSLEADQFEMERTDAVGTRHRSMYRLCARVPDALGIVVSQDGGIRFVKQVDGRVMYWDQVPVSPGV
jgi:hypothetical protein